MQTDIVKDYLLFLLFLQMKQERAIRINTAVTPPLTPITTINNSDNLRVSVPLESPLLAGDCGGFNTAVCVVCRVGLICIIAELIEMVGKDVIRDTRLVDA